MEKLLIGDLVTTNLDIRISPSTIINQGEFGIITNILSNGEYAVCFTDDTYNISREHLISVKSAPPNIFKEFSSEDKRQFLRRVLDKLYEDPILFRKIIDLIT